ncbi:MAG: hypothetical protein ACI3VB_08835 [Oscillospiraceae bacterium]
MIKHISKIVLKCILTILAVTILIFTIFYFIPCESDDVLSAKPVIYLYPEETAEVTVTLDYTGTLTTTYPEYDGIWHVVAEPDGTLTNLADGREYSYLFWEGTGDMEPDFSHGFCIAGEDTASFLQKVLSDMGLTPREYNEFIVYWLPLMEGNEYNLISFQQEAYTEAAGLTISPEPDSLLRVFMAWKPLDKPIDIEPQTFSPFSREGFTVVEWGGSEIK